MKNKKKNTKDLEERIKLPNNALGCKRNYLSHEGVYFRENYQRRIYFGHSPYALQNLFKRY
ncbi:MAG: hypothetical protein Q7S27_02200 [Nanoarchaeota archaeon]|nr:hypothetical protein [Nanoarchaeota archaeon]